MQLGAAKAKVVDIPLEIDGSTAQAAAVFQAAALSQAAAVSIDGSGADIWVPFAPRLNRREVTALVLLSIALHALLAVRLSRSSSASTAPHEQQVVIEMITPPPSPPPAVEQPKAIEPEKPAPVARKAEVHKPEPRTVAKLEPIVPQQTAAPTNELPALPTGDEPSLAMAGGKGTGSVAPSPPASVAKPAPPAPVAAHEGANYLKNPRPAYPEIAMRRGWEGQVLLRVRVSPDGRPTSISVATTSGRDILDQAAIDAVRGWTFVPARRGNEAVAGWVNVPVVFHLQ